MLINPETLLARIKIAKNQTPRLVREELEKSKLEKINIDNLQHGLDSDGFNMPSYRNPDYANFKTTINPNNRGFWDLRLHGEYYRGIKVEYYGSIVFFKQIYSNDKISWLNERLGGMDLNPLGITEEQMFDVQMKNKPAIRKKLDKIING